MARRLSSPAQHSLNGGTEPSTSARRICRQLYVEAAANESGLHALLACKVVLPTSAEKNDPVHLLHTVPLARLASAEAYVLPLVATDPAPALEAARKLGLQPPLAAERDHEAATSPAGGAADQRTPSATRRRRSSVGSTKSAASVTSGRAPPLRVEVQSDEIVLRQSRPDRARPGARSSGGSANPNGHSASTSGAREYLVVLHFDLSAGRLNLPLFANSISIPTPLCLRNTLTLTLPSPPPNASFSAWDLSVRPSLSDASSLLHTASNADSTQITGNFPSTPSLSLRWAPQLATGSEARLVLPHAILSTAWVIEPGQVARAQVDVRTDFRYPGLREKQWVELEVGPHPSAVDVLDCVGTSGATVLDWQIGAPTDETSPSQPNGTFAARMPSPDQSLVAPVGRKTSGTALGLGVPSSSASLATPSVARRRRSSNRLAETRPPTFHSLFDTAMPAPPVLDTSFVTEMSLTDMLETSRRHASSSSSSSRPGVSGPSAAAELRETEPEPSLWQQAAPFDPEASAHELSLEDGLLQNSTTDDGTVEGRGPSAQQGPDAEPDLLQQAAPFGPETRTQDVSFENDSLLDSGRGDRENEEGVPLAGQDSEPEPDLLQQAAPFDAQATAHDISLDDDSLSDSGASLADSIAGDRTIRGRAPLPGQEPEAEADLLQLAAPFDHEASTHDMSFETGSLPDSTHSGSSGRALVPLATQDPDAPVAPSSKTTIIRVQVDLGPALRAFAVDNAAERPSFAFQLSLVGTAVVDTGNDKQTPLPPVRFSSADAEDGIVTVCTQGNFRLALSDEPTVAAQQAKGGLHWTTSRSRPSREETALEQVSVVLLPRKDSVEASPQLSAVAGVPTLGAELTSLLDETEVSFAESLDADADTSLATIMPGPDDRQGSESPSTPPHETPSAATDSEAASGESTHTAVVRESSAEGEERVPVKAHEDSLLKMQDEATQTPVPPPMSPATPPPAVKRDTKEFAAQTLPLPSKPTKRASASRDDPLVKSLTRLLMLVTLALISTQAWHYLRGGHPSPTARYRSRHSTAKYPSSPPGAPQQPQPLEHNRNVNTLVSFDRKTTTVTQTVFSTETHVATVTSVSTRTEHRTITSLHSLTTTVTTSPTASPRPVPAYFDDFTAAAPATPSSTVVAPFPPAGPAALAPNEAPTVATQFVIWLHSVRLEVRAYFLHWRRWLRV
ncbi:hypothetical protein JCM3774_006659 [Rhodotorula dairenensis]